MFDFAALGMDPDDTAGNCAACAAPSEEQEEQARGFCERHDKELLEDGATIESRPHQCGWLHGQPAQSACTGFTSFAQHWEASAAAFVDMIRAMRRSELQGGRGWMEGMQQLISNTPKSPCGQSLRFDDFAAPLLRDYYVHWYSQHAKAIEFRKIYGRLELKVINATKHLRLAWDWTLRAGAFGETSRKMARTVGAQEDPPFGGFGVFKRGLLFVGLPLTLYLSDSPHLYTLVRRMRSLAALQPASVGPAALRAALDCEGQPYAVLIYALLAALQMLHTARLPKGRSRGAQGLEGLSATALRGPGPAGFGVREVPESSKLIFRGIWVPAKIDEDMAARSWSFNSFSRSMDGVLWVLDFYAVEETLDPATAALAWRDAHVLVYVARFHEGSAVWAFPVQFFNAGIVADVEKEVLVPPFVRYRFEVWDEGDIDVSTAQAAGVREARLAELERRWGVSLAEEAPLLLELLRGRGSAAYAGLNRDLQVTVRFVSGIEPAQPMQQLFGPMNQPPEETLLAFPPCDGVDSKEPVTTVFGAGRFDAMQEWRFGEEQCLSTEFHREEDRRNGFEYSSPWDPRSYR